jgi:hypothetical protein
MCDAYSPEAQAHRTAEHVLTPTLYCSITNGLLTKVSFTRDLMYSYQVEKNLQDILKGKKKA